MSTLEESIKALAESNVALAKAQTYYADTINKFGLKINEANGEAGSTQAAEKTTTEKPKGETAAAKKKRQAEEAAAAAKNKEADDGFGEEAQETFTADDVKAKLMAVKNAAGDKAPALAIIKEYGYNAIPEVKEKDYAAVVRDCDTWLEENA